MSLPDNGGNFELGGWRSDTTIRYGSLLLLLVSSLLFSGFKTDIADGIVWVLNLMIVLSAYRLTSITNTPTKMAVFAAFAFGTLVLLVLTDTFDTGRGWGYLAQFGLLILIALGLVGSILRRPQVDAQTLVGAAAVYVLIGLAFSWLYLAIDVWDDSQISLDPANTPEYPEFSFIVLTTIGFGNQLPTAALAARLVVIEALIAQLFLATFVARMVAMYGTRRAPEVDEANRDTS